ncbi:ParA family protein [Sedimentibacter hydroxybenzoicus DSM 7310]|uniref:Sporulation initiation inhibitor protein Soj n=1 Tax=Sedimentibacter hydroxybenzoicus DSM 7310 TaxID=1123245 RepID=A0A974BH34_SEDHY|nr:ParA family protein [Sedimentibacter hydroxybenzoicus]NYB72575.1 ParA family protein [Sedimentibacter hydroxybenzoicus DSM 7310]
MAKIISVTNQKGGVGKTTTTGAVAAGYKLKGYKVLCVDLDPQANLSFSAGAETEECPTIYEILKGEANTYFSIQKMDSFDIISSNILLSGIELEFTQTGREYLLKEALSSVKDKYDYIFLDTPPALSILTVNAFTASDFIIIPMLADIFSLQGIAQLSETIDRVRKYCNSNVKVEGIVLTKFNMRTVLSREIKGTAELIAERLNTEIFNTTIRSSVAVMEAQTNQLDIYNYSPKNGAAKDYMDLVEELIERGL